MSKKLSIKHVGSFVSVIILLAAVGYDAYLLWKNAFDFPWFDEWEMFPSGSLSNVFRLYHGHLSVFYELASEFMYAFWDWNLRYFCFFAFGVYCLTALFYYQGILKYVTAGKTYWWLPLCCLPLFAPLLGWCWLMPLLIQTYTYILFALVAVYFGFVRDGHWWSVGAFTVAVICCGLAMNMPLAIGALGAFIGKELIFLKENYKRGVVRMVVPVVIFALAEYFFFWPKTHVEFEEWRTINVFSYWYLELVSFYVWNSLSIFLLAQMFPDWVYVGCFIIHAGFLAAAFFEQYKQRSMLCLWAVLAAVMFNVLVVVAVRHGEVYNYSFTFIRHNVVTFVMVPVTLCIFLLAKSLVLRRYGLFLLGLMFVGFVLDTKYSTQRFSFYADLLYKDMCVCLNHYYYIGDMDKWQCTNSFYVPVDEYFAEAQVKNLHFVKTMRGCFYRL